MSPDLAGGLRALAEALPAGTAVPVPRELLLELLEGNGAAVHTCATPPDLTVAQVAERFGRAASTVRGWVAAGQLQGAYHFRGRELRIPAAAIQAFESQQRGPGAIPPPKRSKASHRRGQDLDLGRWRRSAP